MNSSRQTMVSVTNFRHASTDEVAQVSCFHLQDESSNKENESALPDGKGLTSWRNTSPRYCPSTAETSSFNTDTLVRNPDATISTPCATAGSNEEVICRFATSTKADHAAHLSRPLQVLGQFQPLEVIPATDKVLTSISSIEICVHSKYNVGQTPIHEQSDSTSTSKENGLSKGVERLETETRVVDSNDVINTMGAFPMNTEHDCGFHVSPTSFASDHLSELGEQEARSPHCNAKYPATHYPVIPLADVTEAYTDLQGGWMLPFETKPNFQHDIIMTKTLDDDSAKIPLHSSQAKKIHRNSKDCENIFKNDELEHRYRRHTKKALTDAKPSDRLPSHTTRGLIRI